MGFCPKVWRHVSDFQISPMCLSDPDISYHIVLFSTVTTGNILELGSTSKEYSLFNVDAVCPGFTDKEIFLQLLKVELFRLDNWDILF